MKTVWVEAISFNIIRMIGHGNGIHQIPPAPRALGTAYHQPRLSHTYYLGPSPGRVIFFSTLVPGSGTFHLSGLGGLGYGLGLGLWVVFTIIVSLTLTPTLITTLTVILP